MIKTKLLARLSRVGGRFSKIFAFLLCSFFSGTNAQKLITYPVPEGIPHNNDFDLKARVPGREWQDLYEYQVQVDMHKVQNSSMAYFDFEGSVEISVTCNYTQINTVRIRPLSYNIKPEVKGNIIVFRLVNPCNVSVEVNGDIFRNLHIFSNTLETNRPDPKDTSVIYLTPGIHAPQDGVLKMASGKTLYLSGGAILKAKILCDNVNNVKVIGRGILYQGQRGIEITNSRNVEVNDLIIINPQHYTVYGGQSDNITIRSVRSFSAKGWADGIDLMSCSDVLVENVFLRTSDDCIALYCHRWNFFGDSRNIIVRNATLWADVAHPILIGTHGNPVPGKSETIENVTFSNIDILNHDEPQLNYQGCMSINVSDENLARNIRFENIRVEDFEQGQLINLRVTFNRKYAKAPGRGIENVYFKDIIYTGNRSNISVIEGYDYNRSIKNIVFENLVINGMQISENLKKPGYIQLSDFARFYIGPHVDNFEFLPSLKPKNTNPQALR